MLNKFDYRATCQLNPTCGLNSPNTCGGSCPVASTFAQAASYSKVTFVTLKVMIPCLPMILSFQIVLFLQYFLATLNLFY